MNFETEDPNMSSGRIVQIIGAVIDVQFPRDEVPKVYDALKVPEKELTLEVQQQLGEVWFALSPWVLLRALVVVWQ